MPHPFRHLLRVRYPECDAQGIVFNARYGDWADLATTELLRALDPAYLTPASAVDYRLRAQATEWLAPARFDDVVSCEPEVSRVGETSFDVTTAFRRWPDGPLLATTRTTYVRVDPTHGVKVPVGPSLAARLRGGARGRVTDHAGVGGGRVLALVPPGSRRTMAWRNGGGVTHELWKEGDGVAGFGLRVSIAEVAADGPFSRFEGVDRVILLLEGRGFTLRRADGLELGFPTPLVPYAFAGEDGYHCALHDGPVLDFNVMADRATRRAGVSHHGPGATRANLLYALAAGRIGEDEVEAGTLAAVEGVVVTTVPCLAVFVTAVPTRAQSPA